MLSRESNAGVGAPRSTPGLEECRIYETSRGGFVHIQWFSYSVLAIIVMTHVYTNVPQNHMVDVIGKRRRLLALVMSFHALPPYQPGEVADGFAVHRMRLGVPASDHAARRPLARRDGLAELIEPVDRLLLECRVHLVGWVHPSDHLDGFGMQAGLGIGGQDDDLRGIVRRQRHEQVGRLGVLGRCSPFLMGMQTVKV